MVQISHLFLLSQRDGRVVLLLRYMKTPMDRNSRGNSVPQAGIRALFKLVLSDLVLKNQDVPNKTSPKIARPPQTSSKMKTLYLRLSRHRRPHASKMLLRRLRVHQSIAYDLEVGYLHLDQHALLRHQDRTFIRWRDNYSPKRRMEKSLDGNQSDND